MTDQHYGTAPCGCSRPTDSAGEYVCREHGCRAWHAASAIASGLRAIAGWPLPFFGVDRPGDVPRLASTKDPAAQLSAIERAAERWRKDYEGCTVDGWPEPHHWVLPPEIADKVSVCSPIPGEKLVRDGDDYVLVREEPKGYTARVTMPSTRTTCYTCGRRVPCKEHTQPEEW